MSQCWDDRQNAEETTDLSFGGIYHKHAGPFASWMREKRWTSPLQCRETRPRRMTCWLSRENGKVFDSDEAKRMICAEGAEGDDYMTEERGNWIEEGWPHRLICRRHASIVASGSAPRCPANDCGVIASQVIQSAPTAGHLGISNLLESPCTRQQPPSGSPGPCGCHNLSPQPSDD